MSEAAEIVLGIPTEAELTLLCLDYLRDLRRNYPPQLLRNVEGLDPKYITMACWALNRAFVSPPHMTAKRGNDAFFESEYKEHNTFPSLATMEKELLYEPDEEEDQKKEDEDQMCYEYDDAHASNSHRFYPLAGLASGPSLRGPLTLGEITAAGLCGLGARSRLEAERDMVQSDLFKQFVLAVKDKGFFDDPANDRPFSDPIEEEKRLQRQEQVYEDRYRKVVAKFRTKLATKADAETMGDLIALAAAEQQRLRREQRIHMSLNEVAELTKDDYSNPPTPKSYLRSKAPFVQKFQQQHYDDPGDMESVLSAMNPVDVEEAEKLKHAGNGFMQKKDFQRAADCYTKALKLSPNGPHSHVYFSNRAAALVSMKRYKEAILDSERSLALKPDYGKAHARLGLAHFLLGNYRQAMEAYTVSLKYEPDNKSSRNYLEKAAKRLAEAGEDDAATQMSFSVVSELGRAQNRKVEPEEPQVEFEREAEKCKVKGNSFMTNREYEMAMKAYTQAIDFSPQGPQAHVYYSNRAAALCYLERYKEAEADSLRSLALNPSYGKAHARLGLSRFFMQDYEGAVQAYTAALKYDPDNSASKSYLAKAKAKLDASAEATARRMMENPGMRALASKVISSGADSNALLNDPEIQTMAKKALSDPSVLAAINRKSELNKK